MDLLLLFDGNAILHRAFHALPPLTTIRGEPINAVYGMISILLRLVGEFKPNYLAFAFDTKEPTFRNELSPEYQAHRPEVEQSLISQFQKARDTLKAFNIVYYEKPGFEADDLIGTISKKISENTEIIVVTGDRDLLQLINPHVRLFMPAGGLSGGKLFDDHETHQKMGVWPWEIVDFKALVGDQSDNYKGVPGIGPKTAIHLIEKYKSLENIYKNIDSLPNSTREKLIKNKESALLSQKLAKIVDNIEIENFSLQEMKNWSLGSGEGLSLFEEYGFKTLTKRTKEVHEKQVAEKQQQLL